MNQFPPHNAIGAQQHNWTVTVRDARNPHANNIVTAGMNELSIRGMFAKIHKLAADQSGTYGDTSAVFCPALPSWSPAHDTRPTAS